MCIRGICIYKYIYTLYHSNIIMIMHALQVHGLYIDITVDILQRLYMSQYLTFQVWNVHSHIICCDY